MPVHIYGRQCDVGKLREAIKPNTEQILVVEDGAEAHGVRPHPQSDAFVSSHYKNKIVAGEEGGSIWFRDRSMAYTARQLRSLGFTEAHDFRHVPRGCNYRIANSQANRIRNSLRQFQIQVQQRREIEGWYEDRCPVEWKMPARQSPWIYDLRIPGLTRERQSALVSKLQLEGFQARHGFKPLSSQPEYKHCLYFGNRNAYRLANEIIYLQLQPRLVTQDGVDRAFTVIEQFMAKGK
jgi:dTDP-4-amino-4,6-dideoxygalactose transaminase